MIKALCMTAAFIGGLSGTAFAQPTAMRSMASAATTRFIRGASQSDEFEITAAKIAISKGNHAARRFAARMVRDHSMTTASLHRAIRRAGMMVPPPPPLRSDQRNMIARLQSVSGPRFNSVYRMEMVQSHRQALALESRYAMGGSVPPIRAAARSAVPLIKSHLRMAERMGPM